MSLPLIFACLWALAANLIAMVPSRRNHWPAAYILIACGIPLLGWATLELGPWIGLLLLAAGMSILRWPVYYFYRRVRGRAS